MSKKLKLDYQYGDNLQHSKSITLTFEEETDRESFLSHQHEGWAMAATTSIGQATCGNPTRIKRVNV